MNESQRDTTSPHTQPLTDAELQELLKPRKRSPLGFIIMVVLILGAAVSVWWWFNRPVAQPQRPTQAARPTKVPTKTVRSPKKPPYSLTVSSDPVGALIFAEGAAIGATPFTLTKRYHLLTFLKHGYKPRSWSASAQSEATTHHIKLERLTEQTQKAPTSWDMYLCRASRIPVITENWQPTLKPLWRQELAGKTLASPVIREGMVFVSGKSPLLSALSLQDGSRQWNVDGGGGTDSTPVIVGQDLMIGSNSSSLKAFQRLKGKPRGELSLSSYLASAPITDGENLYVITAHGTLHCLSPRKGVFKQVSFDELWRFTADERLVSAPLIRQDRIFIASATKVFALNKLTGQQLWQATGNAEAAVKSVSGLRIANTEQAPPPSLGVGAEGLLFASGSALFCFHEQDGTEAWAYKAESQIGTTPIVSGGLVIVGCTDGTLRAVVEDSGRLVWLRSVGGAVTAAPLAINGYLVIGTGTGGLYLVDRVTGESLAEYSVDGGIVASPALTNNVLVINTVSGKVYAFQVGAS